MKKLNLIKTVFSFWILLIIMSVSWLAFIFVNNFDLIFTNTLVLFAVIVACFSFVTSIFFISKIIVDLIKELRIEREKQKNVNDVYKYNQVVEPPSIYN